MGREDEPLLDYRRRYRSRAERGVTRIPNNEITWALFTDDEWEPEANVSRQEKV